jgi:hypothetical protein
MTETHPDAGFFASVSSAIEAARQRESPERRDSNRREFSCVQLVASMHGGRLPDQSQFRPVRCRNLSPTGFSFIAPRPVDSEEVIVALGQVPFRFFRADVVYCTRPANDDAKGYVVGCRFTGRVAE